MALINTRLLFNPFNWIIVWLMVAFGLLFLTFVVPGENDMIQSNTVS